MTQKEHLDLMEKKFAKALEIAKAKNSDYTGGRDPFSNFKLVESLGVCSVEEGIVVRMSDKLSRISVLLKNKAKVSDESIQDSLQDLANYSIILSNYLDSKQRENK